MRKLYEIAFTGLTEVIVHRASSFTTVLCVLAALVPYLVGLAISQGIKEEATLSLEAGADLYVSGQQFSRQVPLPLSLQAELAQIDGVDQVVPRVVGELLVGRNLEPVVVMGLPSGLETPHVELLEGRLPGESLTELALGSTLAARLKVAVGDSLPPFYRSREGEKVSQVVGVFHSDLSVWSTRLMLTSLDFAMQIFDQPNHVTEFMLTCQASYRDQVVQKIQTHARKWHDASGRPIRVRILQRDHLRAARVQESLHQEGIFNLHYLLAFSIAILAIILSSGVGLRERRQEIAILKATGWQTDEVILRSFVAALVMSLLGASISLLLAYVWLRWGNGFLVASVFVSGVELVPSFPVPFRFLPVPVLSAFLIAVVVVVLGSVYSTWRVAIAPPSQALTR